ncbi:gliding motility-associated-like protein [Mucilaginibacter oryzae]|uniref:Gliding motility-associated-like protein n=1 Tax=Mucilaginibacter oryzae TaxID=468058 RepID=A0A316HE15_9SPHI|nr:PKD domain-containing protein [Mucilaginibacter oryzae]PWK78828.1 gliding motility-associated-like protein [Mucilaginibacter oryzae]
MSKTLFWRALFSVALLLCFSFYAGAQGSTNQGTEFYTAYMAHINGAAGAPGAINGGSQMQLYITSDVNTTAIVEVADGSFSGTFQVTAKDVTAVSIPASAFLGSQGTFLKAIHIKSLKPVAVYAHIFAESVSGATLLLPVNTLGKDYLSINYKQISNSNNTGGGNGGGGNNEGKPSYSTFAVIATEDNTTVEVTPSQTLLDGKQAGVAFNLNLKKGEVYQALSETDLTGTRVRSIVTASGSCKKIAVFSGSSKISIGCQGTKGSSDNLFQQVYPLAVWGKNYMTVPLKSRIYDIIRVVPALPGTMVNINGKATLINGMYTEFTSSVPNVITADKAVQVVQYAVTEGETNTSDCQLAPGDVGDPEMIYLTPIEQTLDHVTLNSTRNFNILTNYINVIIKSAAVPTFSLDGKPYTNFTPMPGTGDYSYAQIVVSAGVHNIKASDGFNAIAYGFGRKESYGYAAGTNLKDLNEFITLINPVNKASTLNGCTNTDYKLQLTLPYQTPKITWDLKDGSVPIVIDNPTPTGSVIKDSKVLYTYECPVKRMYPDGDYSVTATVFNPVADECGSNEEINFDFNISVPPVVSFGFANTCFGSAVQFSDHTTSGTRQIKTWHWDFGDGITDVVQNPAHKYSKPGDYTVSLFATNENGCASLSDPVKVHVSIPPVAAFNASTACVGQDVIFTDNSTSKEGDIVSRQWDFGDGLPVETRTDHFPFKHLFTKAGDYVVKLTVTNTYGCTGDVITRVVTVYPVPVPDFLLPEACEGDFAQFTDQSSIDDGTGADFTYQWNFGDPAATPGNPNISNQKNPVHRYVAGIYQVSLTVTSKYGCSVTSAPKSLTINGSKVKAALNVLNPADLCSNREVFFENYSTANYGQITRLEVTYDAADASTKVIYDYPVYGQQLRHTYPSFTRGTRNVTVRVVAYSGANCFDVAEVPVVLKGSPVVTFDPAPVFCIESPAYTLMPKLDGEAGNGVFSGKGVSSTGIFDPAVSGPGTFDIRYIYTTQNSCADTVTQQVTVDSPPFVSLGDSFTMLEGTKHILKPQVNDQNLSYKWYPATGLDHNDVANPTASPTEDITYHLTVTSAHMCKAEASVAVHVLKFLVIPKVFTPNGDGVNDFWDVKYLQTYPNNKVDVYNRYGERVYSSIGYSKPWDGRLNGSDLPPGTYYYIIDPKNGREVIAGNVTIIR